MQVEIVRKKPHQEFPLWLISRRTWHCLNGDAGSIPGLTLGSGAAVLPWLGRRLQQQLWINPWPRNFHLVTEHQMEWHTVTELLFLTMRMRWEEWFHHLIIVSYTQRASQFQNTKLHFYKRKTPGLSYSKAHVNRKSGQCIIRRKSI